MAQQQDWFSQFQTVSDDDFFNQFQSVTPPQPREQPGFLSRSFDAAKGFGSFLGDVVMGGLYPNYGAYVAAPRVAEGMAEPFKQIGQGNIGTGILGLMGADPSAVQEDWQSGNYGALLGDFALPAAIGGITRGAKVLGPRLASRTAAPIARPPIPTPEPTPRFYSGVAGVADTRMQYPHELGPKAKVPMEDWSIITRPEFTQASPINPIVREATMLPGESLHPIIPDIGAELAAGRTGVSGAPFTHPMNLLKPEPKFGFSPEPRTAFKPEFTDQFINPGRITDPARLLPPKVESNIQSNLASKGIEPTNPLNALREAWNLSKGLMSVDLPFITSAAFRQGLPLIGTSNWFKAWGPSIKAYGSKAFSDAHKALLESDPLFVREGKGKSIADLAGVELSDPTTLSHKHEAIRSTLAEKVPIWGKVVAASNRGFGTYVNELKASTLRNFYEAMPDKNNLVALKAIGDAVNNLTSSGVLGTRVPFTKGKEISFEKHAQILSDIFWSPKHTASRMQFFNPMNYFSGPKQVRIEHLKGALRVAGAWFTFAKLGELAGAEVNLNPTNSDFGKIKFGDLRLDPAGGFQQFLVLMAKLARNESTSSVTDETKPFGVGYKPETRGSTLERFVSNKLHPSLKYFYDAAYASQQAPFPMFDRGLQLTLPMITEDLIEIAREEPHLVPFLAPLISGGMGSQFYQGGDFNESKFIPPENDILIGSGYVPRQGGNVRFIRP